MVRCSKKWPKCQGRNQLFNVSEKRLARLLLLMTHFGKARVFDLPIPSLGQRTLAEMEERSPSGTCCTTALDRERTAARKGRHSVEEHRDDRSR